MKLRVVVLLISLILLFSITSLGVSAGCCVWVDENQTNPGVELSLYPSTATDRTCNDVLTLTECENQASGAFLYLDVSCSDVDICGCCACDRGISYFGLGNLYTTENFCNSYCEPREGEIIPFLPASQCTATAIKHIISGTVYDRFNNPVPDASVSETRGGIAKTDGSGKYILALLQDQTEVVADKGGIKGSIQVDATVRTTGWDITLNVGLTTAIVGGRVIQGTTSIPIEGVDVALTDKQSASTVFRTVTNSSGGFQFFDVPRNKDYSIAINGCGIEDYGQDLQVINDLIMDYLVDIPATEIVQGVVEDQNGIPLADVEIVLGNKKAQRSVKTSSAGAYSFNDVDSNCKYSVSATLAGFAPQNKTAQLFSNDATLTNTVNFALDRISGADFCTTVGWCTGPDLIVGTSDDCNVCGAGQVCDQSSRSCKSSTTKECCRYDFLCPAGNRVNDPVCSGQGLQGCSTSCKQVNTCPVNTKLNPFNVGDPFVCSCSGQDVAVSSALGLPFAGGKYCCPRSTNPISDVPCQYQNFAILKGRVTDVSGNNLTAAIKVDEKFAHRSFVSYSNSLDGGKYEIYLDPNLNHEMEFAKPPLQSRKFAYDRNDLSAGQSYKLDVVLDVSTQMCQYPNAGSVPSLEAEHLKCQNSIRLSWDDTYCGTGFLPDHFVITDENNNFERVTKGNEILVEDLSWDTSYNFSIKAVFSDGTNIWESNKTFLNTLFNPGAAVCANACTNDYEVCSNDVRSRCDDTNQPISVEDCSLKGNWYCAGEEQTKCLEESQCGGYSSKIPFLGLLFNDRICSGVTLDKGCYLDRSNTSVDYCFNCPKPGEVDFSCYTYESEFACENNRCGVPNDCSWIMNDAGDSANGYCIPESNVEVVKKEQDLSSVQNRCDLCSLGGALFKNYECNQYICSGLGVCELTKTNGINTCETCSSSACSDYTNEQSCINATGKSQAARLLSGGFQYSDDACGLGVCAWNGTVCFKDADNDLSPDCEVNGVIQRSCEQDNTPPETTLQDQFILLSNETGPANVIKFDLTEDVSEFNYCLGRTDCTDFRKIDGSNTNYIFNKEITLNPIGEFQNIVDRTGSYVLKWHSIDTNHNVEEIKSSAVFVDADSPSVNVFYKDDCINCNSQIDCKNGLYYESKVSILVSTDEYVDCTSALIPPGYDRSSTPYKESFGASLLQQKILAYPSSGGLNDGEYLFLMECTDRAGNVAEVRELMRINAYDLIQSISPRGAIKDGVVTLSATTSKASQCKVAIDNGNLQTMDLNQVKGSYEKIFNARPDTSHDYGVLCEVLQGSQCDYEIGGFALDFTAPEIEVEIEGDKYADDGWLHTYSMPTQAVFTIKDPGYSGSEYKYGVNEFVYCIDYTGLRCDPGSSGGVIVKLTGDTYQLPIVAEQSICYYATDNGGNKAPLKCGKLIKGTLPDVRINSPNGTHVTINPILNVNGTYDVDATECVVSIMNGTNKYDFACTLDPVKKQFFSTATLLSPGVNTVSVQIREASGLFGEEKIDVYYDRFGPDIELASADTFEYGGAFNLSFEVKDSKFTELITPHDYGLVSQVSMSLIARSSGSISGYQYNLKFDKTQWYAELIPQKSATGLYDLYPGEYVAEVIAIDKFGNQNIIIQNFSIIDSSASDMKINVVPSVLHNDKFYTSNLNPTIYVNTTVPSNCKVLVGGSVGDFDKIDDFRHKFSSTTYMRFSPGTKQRFDGEIVCEHQFQGNEQHKSITINFDDLPPAVDFSLDEGYPVSFKHGQVFVLDKKTQGQLIGTLHVSEKSNEKIKCTYDCVKDGSQRCGELAVSNRGNFVDEVDGQFVRVAFTDEKHSSGEYTYFVECTDVAGNRAVDQEVTIFAVNNKEDFEIIETSPAVVNNLNAEIYVKTNYPATCSWDKTIMRQALADVDNSHPKGYLHKEYFYFLPTPTLVDATSYSFPIVCERHGNTDVARTDLQFAVDLSAPGPSVPRVVNPGARVSIPLVINDVDIVSGLGNQGVYSVGSGLKQTSYRVVDGVEKGGAYVKLIASTNKKAHCRYDMNNVPYSSMFNEFTEGYGFYSTSSNVLLDDATNTTIYVACEDGYGSTSDYEVNIEVDSDAPIEIVNAKPQGIINSRSVIVEADTYRDLNCVFDDDVSKNNPMNKQLVNGKWHHTSLGIKFITLVENFDYEFKIRCGTLGNTVEEVLNFRIDATIPSLTLLTPAQSQSVIDPIVNVSGIVNEDVELEVYVNEVLSSRFNANGRFSDLIFLQNEGSNIIKVLARDTAGNIAVKNVEVIALEDRVSIVEIYPDGGLTGTHPRITAKASGELNELSTTFEVYRNGNPVTGTINYNTPNYLFSFTPTLGYLEDGEYMVRVLPIDKNGNVGYGRSAFFTVDSEAPTILWVRPTLEKPISTDQKLNAELDIISNSINNPVISATINSETDLAPLFFRNGRYVGNVNADEGANIIVVNASTATKTSSSRRIISMDREGPIGNVMPDGVSYFTRPALSIKYDEDVTLVSATLVNQSNHKKSFPIELVGSSKRQFNWSVLDQLTLGTYLFTVNAKDGRGNTGSTQQIFSISVGDVELNLKYPKLGVATNPDITLELETNQDAVCRYSAVYSSTLHTKVEDFDGIFDLTGRNLHVENNFNIGKEAPLSSKLYVMCRGSSQRDRVFEFDLSYDLSAPIVTYIEALPEIIAEYPLTSTLIVETDDSARCRYSCDNVVAFSSMINTMDNGFTTDHEAVLNNLQDFSTYSCNVACRNKAGQLAAPANVEIIVNTSMEPSLLMKSPVDGEAYAVTGIPIEFISQKSGQCAYSLDGGSVVNFPDIGRKFNSMLGNLTEGAHLLSITCVYAQGSLIEDVNFVVDLTPPISISVDDGYEACSSDNLNVSFFAEDPESGIAYYEYAIRTPDSTEYGVMDWTFHDSEVLNSLPISLDPRAYVFAVRAVNNAGLVSSEVEDLDGVFIDPLLEICVETNPPNGTVVVEEFDGFTNVSLVCEDDTECSANLQYGYYGLLETCTPDTTYTSTLKLTEPGMFCYYVEDLAGNFNIGEEAISVRQAGVLECPNDLDCDGKINSEDDDIDGDGLKNWEDSDDDNDGAFDYDVDGSVNTDTDDDNDGIKDADEVDTNNDLDDDGLNNLEDADDDGDNIPDCNDEDDDNDGILDELDEDDDNDGISDLTDKDHGGVSVADVDNDLDDDGIPNFADEDIDNDGLVNENDEDMDNDGVLNCIDQDNDNDGILNSKDPDVSDDADQDGLSNAYEDANGMNKFDPDDAQGDIDGDGLSNLEEYKFGTSPSLEDSDGDGVSDYDELRSFAEQYDPLSSESKPKSSVVLFVLIAFIVLAVVLGSYFGYKHFTKPRIIPTVRPRPKAIPKLVPPSIKYEDSLQRRLEELHNIRETQKARKEETRRKLFEGKPKELDEESRTLKARAEDIFKDLDKIAKKSSQYDKIISHAASTKDEFERLAELTSGRSRKTPAEKKVEGKTRREVKKPEQKKETRKKMKEGIQKLKKVKTKKRRLEF